MPKVNETVRISPLAQVAKSAQLADGVSVDKFAIIEAGVRLGKHCQVRSHAQILRGSELGDNCLVERGAIIGGDPQDLSFDKSSKTFVKIGSACVFRENVTIHRSASEGEATIIGDENFFMVNSHVGHDCKIGAKNIFANNVMLAGHVDVGDNCFFGGGAGVHQFVRVGDFCMVQGNGSLSQDAAPYLIYSGLNGVVGLNVIGLRRAGFSLQERNALKSVFKEIYLRGKKPRDLLMEVESTKEVGELAKNFLQFFLEKSRKGVCMRLRQKD